MPLYSRLRTAILGAIGLIMASSPAWAETLKVGGAGVVTELLRQLAPAFKADTGITLEVIAGIGTSGGIAALADGKLGIAFAGRGLRDKERAKGLKVAATFRTPYGLVTSRAGPDGLKSAEIPGLFAADRPLWPDGTPILFTLRPVDDSDNIVLADLFPGMADALQHLRTRRDLSIAGTDQDNADIAEKLKGSLAGASLTQIMAEKRNLRFVSIDGFAASLENYQNGSYPHSRPVYAMVPSTVSPEAEAFLGFLASAAGEALLRQNAMIVVK